MRLTFDHLVHFVQRTPQEASELFCEAGFHAVAGGRHASWGTWNSLSYFGLSYVEFLAVEHKELARQSDNPLIRQCIEDEATGEGFGQIALRTNEMDKWAERLRSQGMHVTGPVEGRRTRDDGTTLRWRMLFLEDADSALLPPFLIEWQQTDEERIEDLAKRGIVAAHPNGASHLQSIGYAVADLDVATARWHSWFGWEKGEKFHNKEVGAICQAFELPGGNIVLCQPTEEGLAHSAWSTRGQRPFFARLAGTGKESEYKICGGSYFLTALE
ncbi:VOC family protein [Brevibacillus sp. 179-C9.3 HS]|uniref:VOC family protein n=1 Tax=unclassified Brevibacillus TaxID=2684853 RepID=UPI00399F6B45